MIISHKHKFIFIKTRKTAGTSIEIALSSFCGPDDIITPISAEDEDIRKKLGYRGPQNCYLPYKKYTFKDWIRFFIKRKKALKFYNHISASEIKDKISDDIWESYFKFSIARNPWDMAISLYYYKLGNNMIKNDIALSDFLENHEMSSNYNLYTINGEVVVNYICLYENLKEDLNKVVNYIGLPKSLELPNAKGSYRKDKRHYKEVLTESDVEVIRNKFSKEISLLDYKY